MLMKPQSFVFYDMAYGMQQYRFKDLKILSVLCEFVYLFA